MTDRKRPAREDDVLALALKEAEATFAAIGYTNIQLGEGQHLSPEVLRPSA